MKAGYAVYEANLGSQLSADGKGRRFGVLATVLIELADDTAEPLTDAPDFLPMIRALDIRMAELIGAINLSEVRWYSPRADWIFDGDEPITYRAERTHT